MRFVAAVGNDDTCARLRSYFGAAAFFFGAVFVCLPSDFKMVLARSSSSATLGGSGPAHTPPSSKKRGLAHLYPEAEWVTMPRPKKSGNKVADEEVGNIHQCFEEIGTILNYDRPHVMPLWFKLQERVYQQKADEEAAKGGGDQFDRAPATLRSIDEEWLLDFLVGRGGVSMQKIVAARRQDPDSIYQLAAWELQVGLQFRLPEEFRTKQIAHAALTALADLRGGRLQKTSRETASLFTPTGLVNWTMGCYRLSFSGDTLAKICHRASGCEVDVSEEKYTKAWKLEGNWSDHDAQLRKGRFPLVKCSLFFDEKKKQGPFGTQVLKPKAKFWTDMVQEAVQKLDEDTKKLKVGIPASSEARDELAKVKEDLKKKTMDRARGQAKSVLESRRKQRQAEY